MMDNLFKNNVFNTLRSKWFNTLIKLYMFSFLILNYVSESTKTNNNANIFTKNLLKALSVSVRPYVTFNMFINWYFKLNKRKLLFF